MARKRKHPEHVNHERWLVSYADFITLLFAFFTTLYAISTVDQKKVGKMVYSMRTAFNLDFFKGQQAESSPVGGGTKIAVLAGPPEPPAGGNGKGIGSDRYLRLVQELTQLAEDPALKGRIEIRQEKRGVVIALSEAAFFGSGSADLQKGTSVALGVVAAKLKEKGYEILVEGHTDNMPVRSRTFRSNWELSTARATTVVAYLVDQMGYEPTKVGAAGYGEHKPVASNDTSEGRARNRRVDIVVSPPSQETAPDSPTVPAASGSN
jgi:chemotaxis protein MotB